MFLKDRHRNMACDNYKSFTESADNIHDATLYILRLDFLTSYERPDTERRRVRGVVFSSVQCKDFSSCVL